MDKATVGKHPCPECGGDLQWNAAKQALACPYCGTVVPLKQAASAPGDGSAAVVEHDLLEALKRMQAPADGPPPLPASAQADAAGSQDSDLAGVHAAVEQLARSPGGGSRVSVSWNIQSDGKQVQGSRQGSTVLDLLRSMADTPQAQRGYGGQRREVQCQSCRAISVFVDGKVADRCEFCGSPSIIAHESLGDAITPQSVLPFKISDAKVREGIRRWYGTRWFAPNRLKSAALTDTLKGVYLPYWTFDAHVSAKWTAESGKHYYTTNSKGERKLNVSWSTASGSLSHFFDDELVPGTVGVHRKLLQEIDKFPTATDLQPYSPEFVRGWLVERYQIDLREASTQGEAAMRAQIRELCANEIPGATYRNLELDASFSDRTFKHVLVPVWLVTYTYGSRNFQIVANGYTGAIAGERPYSWVKIFFASLVALIVLLAILSSSFRDH